MDSPHSDTSMAWVVSRHVIRGGLIYPIMPGIFVNWALNWLFSANPDSTWATILGFIFGVMVHAGAAARSISEIERLCRPSTPSRYILPSIVAPVVIGLLLICAIAMLAPNPNAWKIATLVLVWSIIPFLSYAVSTAWGFSHFDSRFTSPSPVTLPPRVHTPLKREG